MKYVDVHAHLTHSHFTRDFDAVVQRAVSASVKHIVVNGLNPASNDAVLALAASYPSIIVPSLGIYPVDAVNHLLSREAFCFPIASFDSSAEVRRIEQLASQGKTQAIGEIGLDGYWLAEDTFKEQEKIFIALIEIARDKQLPVIVHSRKCEERAIDILKSFPDLKVLMHCFGGKVRLAEEASERYGFYFSIPATARRNEAFSKMLRKLPLSKLLTETDCPYLAPIKGERSEPRDVVDTVAYLCELRQLPLEQGADIVAQNFVQLFAKKKEPNGKI